MVKTLLRLEGLAIFAASVYLYGAHLQQGWLLFVVLILAPDVSMIGFLKSTRFGSITYNAVHNFVLAFVLIAVGFVLENVLVAALGAVLSAHVGIDRFLGYGLKYPHHFKDTHLQHV